MSLFLENSINIMYWPASISLSWFDIWLPLLILLFVLLNVLLFYFFSTTLYGKIMKGVFERSTVVSSLWIRVYRLQYILFIILLIILVLVAWLVLVESTMRPSDSLFYLIKGIGISILVWFSQKQRVFVWAMLYVLVEYFFFIYLWRPIVYKESLILIIILFVLIWKPSWLFSFWKRHI
jgi:branched-subunit amino acid ABC-type transport system permease component